MIESMELFFATYKNIALAFYTFMTFVGVCVAIIFRLVTMYKNKIKDAQEDAMRGQRHEFQAEYFDLQENRQTWLIKQVIQQNREIDRIKSTLLKQ